jgi:hypothetical protein
MPDITTLDAPLNENFDSLAGTGTGTVLPAGWVISESGTNANASYTAGTGSAVLLGIGANAPLSIFTTTEHPSDDFRQVDYTLSGGHLLPTLVDLPA